MTDRIASAREAAAYLRAEADFNRSMVDGRRSHGYSATTPEYVARRLHLAAERDRWADAIEALAVLANVTPPSNREPAETLGNLDCRGNSP